MRRILHLARRFLETLRTRPLTPAEQERVAGWLNPSEAPLFWRQQQFDHRHALGSAEYVAAREPDRTDLIRAALLHDVGKRHSSLGILGRVTASLLALVGLPAPGRLGRYLDHGALGASDLDALAVEPIVVAFAMGHHDACPPDSDAADWAILRESDGE